MCHHWDYENAYERVDEPEIEAEPEHERHESVEADEPEEREDDPLADVPFADD